MAKPSKLPRWSDVSGVNTEPTESKKDRGFQVVEKPPAQLINWLFNLIYQWIAWLSSPEQTWISPTDFCTNAVGTVAAGFDETNGVLLTADATGGQKVAWPVRVRQGAIVTSIDVRLDAEDNSTTSFKLWKWTGLNTGGGAPTMTQIGSTVTSAASGRHTKNLPIAGGLTIDNDTQLFVEWIPAHVGDQIEAYRVNG